MAAYLGINLWKGTRDALVTSPAVKTTVTETAEITGIAVRSETVIASDRAYVFVTAQDGEQLSADSVIAAAMDSEAALERAGRRRELENEISHIETILSGITSADDLTKRDSAIRTAMLSLSACTATGNLSQLDSACVALTSLIFSDSASVSETDLEALKLELRSLENSAYTDFEELLAPQSGLFTTIVDGHEALTPDMLSNLTTTDIKRFMSEPGSIPQGAIGKLITSFRWYFAGVMDDEDAAKLTEGKTVTVSLGRYYGEKVSMRVEHISTSSGGERAVVLSSLNALAETLAMREAAAEIISSEYTGLRVPTKALHVDESGNTFVYVIAANQIAVKSVKTLYQAGDYYLVEIETSADALREGDKIIVSSKTVYEGMIVE
jgi:putative membrane fusion protein